MRLPKPMHRLTFLTPEFAGQFCPLPEGTLTLGRSRENQIILLDDSVSARHCELLVHGPEVIVRERGSRNGTFVNGLQVRAQSGVCHGQRLRFGRVEAVLDLAPPAKEEETDITAFYGHCRTVAAPTNPSPPAAPWPVVLTPQTLGRAGHRPGESTGTHLDAVFVIPGSDVPQLASRGSAHYWRRILHMLRGAPPGTGSSGPSLQPP